MNLMFILPQSEVIQEKDEMSFSCFPYVWQKGSVAG